MPEYVCETDVVSSSNALSSFAEVPLNPMWGAMFGSNAGSSSDQVPQQTMVAAGGGGLMSEFSAESPQNPKQENPMWGAMFGKNVSPLVSSAWCRIPRRRDGAEGDSVEGVRPTGHPLDDLADHL